jgi:hypothetical protein
MPSAALKVQIARRAAQELPLWLERIPSGRLVEFGFKDGKELRQARLLPPIATAMPSRTRGNVLDRAAVEAVLSSNPAEWVVPVAVGERIACLLVLMLQTTGDWAVASFGSTLRATRLQDGLVALGGVKRAPFDRLHLVVFYEPNREFLLVRQSSDTGWDWYDIDAPRGRAPTVMDDPDIAASLTKIRNSPPSQNDLPQVPSERKSRN